MSLQLNDRLLWPEGKKRAFTLSYDDGIEQDYRFLELLNRYKLKCTFNLNSGLFGKKGTVPFGSKVIEHNKLEENKIIETYKGHEIAAHGEYHECLSGMSTAHCGEEVLNCRRQLEKLTGKPVTGFAYAFGAYDESVIKMLKLCGISYARTIEANYDFGIPKDFLRWHPTCHHNHSKLFELADRFLGNDMYFNLYSPAKLFYVWGHSYEFDVDDNWDHIERFFQRISGKKDVWYATNKEIQQYVWAFRQLVFSVDNNTVYNPTAYAVWLGGNFTDKYVKVLPGGTEKLIPPIEM